MNLGKEATKSEGPCAYEVCILKRADRQERMNSTHEISSRSSEDVTVRSVVERSSVLEQLVCDTGADQKEYEEISQAKRRGGAA